MLNNRNLIVGLVGVLAIGGMAITTQAAPGELLRTFTGPTAEAYDEFGSSIAVNGDDIIIGAPRSYFKDGSGVAYIFDGVTGDLKRTFISPRLPDPEYYGRDEFGQSVSWVGDNVLIGAPYDYTDEYHTGMAYLFDGSNGNLLRTIHNPTPGKWDHFGNYVSAIGNDYAISASGDDDLDENAGAVYLYDGASGNLQRTLYIPQQNPNNAYEFFGSSVTTVGSNILVGAYGADAAYLFDGATGNHLRTFANPTGGDDEVGWAATAIGTNVAIGGFGGYEVHLFDGTNGNLIRTIASPTGSRGFGVSIAAVGEDVLIGAYHDSEGAYYTGAAYLFESQTGDLLQTYYNPTPGVRDYFGSEVAVYGNNVLIGADHDSTVAGQAGAVYMFDGAVGNLYWNKEADGDWDVNANWTKDIAPANVHNVFVDPDVNATVTMPVVDRTVKSVTIGGKSGDATLVISDGGNLTTLEHTTIKDNGQLIVEGDFIQSGKLIFELDSMASDYGLVINGDAEFGGEAEFVLNFEMLPGEEFEVISFGSNSSEFSDVIANCDYSGVWFDIVYDSDSASLVADALDGDINLDGVVDLIDLSLFALNWEQAASSWLDGDFNGDGYVDIDDLSGLSSNWGVSLWSPAPAPVGVPEPGTLVMFGLGIVAVLKRRRPRPRKFTAFSRRVNGSGREF